MKKRTDSNPEMAPDKSQGRLNFENVDFPIEKKPSSEGLIGRSHLTWEDHLRYFLQFKRSIFAMAIIVPTFFFAVYLNKDYVTRASFKVEAGQDLTSNILSESLMGVASPQNQLGDISERALIKAQSQNFYDELAFAVEQKSEYSFIRFKLGTERKAWVELLKKVLSGKQAGFGQKDVHSRISEHLEKVISVEKNGDHKITFTVSTKNHNLSANIQKLLIDQAAPILIKEPLREASTALQILEETEATLFSELDSLGEDILFLQKQHNTLMAQELPARYANMRLELEKSLLEAQVEEKGLEKNIEELKTKIKQTPGQDFGSQKELDQLKARLSSLSASRALLERKIKGLNGQYKNLPVFSSELEKIQLRKKIRLEKIHKLTEQMSLAKITLEKIKSAINHLDHKEKIIETGIIKVLTRTFIISGFVLFAYLAGLYYLNGLFPKVMRKEDLDLTNVPMTGIIPKEHIKAREFRSLKKATPRLMALSNFYKRRLEGQRLFTIAPVSGKKAHKQDTLDIIGYCLGKGRKTFVYVPYKGGLTKNDFSKLKKVFGERLEIIEKRASINTMPNLSEVQNFIKTRAKNEFVFILGPGLADSPNSILLSQLTQRTFVITRLFKSSALAVSKFLNHRSKLPLDLRSKFFFTLTNTRPYDDIGTYILQSKFLKENKNELEIVSSKAG